MNLKRRVLRRRKAVTPPLDIEDSSALTAYLRATARIASDESPACTPLRGGVSNRTVLVERPGGESWVLKQALHQLRVREQWFADPRRVEREALGLQWLPQFAPAGSLPEFLFEDPAAHLLAMRAVPQPHENWKTILLRGEVSFACVEQFGRMLGSIHSGSHERRDPLETVFSDRSFFESLRLEPYYRFAAARNDVNAFIEPLVEETLHSRLALVHGDFSPKNILVREGRLILLDHEVIHWGDPAFDLGFAVTHFLSKAGHLAGKRLLFLNCARHFWESYRGTATALVAVPGLEARAVRHTLACMLARIDGRSPLEYLHETTRVRQRQFTLKTMRKPPRAFAELIQVWGAALS